MQQLYPGNAAGSRSLPQNQKYVGGNGLNFQRLIVGSLRVETRMFALK